MILGDRPRILDAERFAAGLRSALEAIVRVRVAVDGREVARGTGWFLTPRVVVVPSFLIDSRGGRWSRKQEELEKAVLEVTVEGLKEGQVQWQSSTVEPPELLLAPEEFQVSLSPSQRAAVTVALLEIEAGPGEKVPLQLNATAPETDSYVYVLSFPQGTATPALSLGQLHPLESPFLTYSADTRSGSSGAPVFDEEWRVIGVHMMWIRGKAGEWQDFGNEAETVDGRKAGSPRNGGIEAAALIRLLEQSRYWPEIAEQQKLANVAAGKKSLRTASDSRADSAGEEQLESILRGAALRLRFDPGKLSEALRSQLQRQVINPSADQWTLKPAVRQQVIQSAGSLDVLRAVAPGKAESTADQVVQKILAGPPYELGRESEDALSWWIQGSHWFAGVAPDLPTPGEVAGALERRRIRSRLEALAGPDFQGRKKELGQLADWYGEAPTAPLLVTGIGGVGKSALVARFAAALPDETLLLWLDFDRADLAPDDAFSVLAALKRQLEVQQPKIPPLELTPDDWKAGAKELAQAIAAAADSDRPPLLVLDSFEVAQSVERYEELWPVLEAIAGVASELRVVVSGRAPVKSLALRGRMAKPLPLGGLARSDSRAWLRKHGIKQPDVLEKVVELAQGLPLILHLARRLVEEGGEVADLPRDLPPEIRAGFLYDRILDRVQDPELKPVATAGLVLRRLAPGMIEPVLGGLVDLPGGTPEDWFPRLSREAALVEGSAILKLRPEVRSAALRQLEMDRPDLVKKVDQRAEKWYSKQDRNDPEIAAELVYHRLRLGKIEAAADAWRPGCSTHLQYADDDLRGEAERNWLRGRLGDAGQESIPLDAWEHEAAERILGARQRGLNRTIHVILNERRERSADSPLIFHEALEILGEGKPEAALACLESAGQASSGVVMRERALLNALLLQQMNRWKEAEQALRTLDNESSWKDRREGEVELMGLQAARVRLSTRLGAELELLRLVPNSGSGSFLSWTSPMDVLLPRLQLLFQEGSWHYEESRTVPLPGSESELEPFARYLEELRTLQRKELPEWLLQARQQVLENQLPSAEEWKAAPPVWTEVQEAAWRRWSVAGRSSFLLGIQRKTLAAERSPLVLSIVGSLALFAGIGSLSMQVPKGPFAGWPLDEVLGGLARDFLSMPGFQEWKPDRRQQEILDVGVGSEWRPALKELLYGKMLKARGQGGFRWAAIPFFFSSPDPLPLLVDRFSGRTTADSQPGSMWETY